ncbi:hypothetical protein SDC9_201213 [bioreactor metagenome]|uniref:Uncharacterized protein n=1 Tax=bioreactor metagenome TaxID=1076179 RepID=A0A645IT32_9ZZZZ
MSGGVDHLQCQARDLEDLPLGHKIGRSRALFQLPVIASRAEAADRQHRRVQLVDIDRHTGKILQCPRMVPVTVGQQNGRGLLRAKLRADTFRLAAGIDQDSVLAARQSQHIAVLLQFPVGDHLYNHLVLP